MKLDGHQLSSLIDLPTNLLVLNVSNCQLFVLDAVAGSCHNLRLLNASFNSVRSLACLVSLRFLTELYVEGNEVSTLNDCAGMERLKLLDASANPVQGVEDMEQLAGCRGLKFLRVKETPASVQPRFLQRAKELFPKVMVSDEEELNKFSAYVKIAGFALTCTSAENTVRMGSDTCSAVLNETKPRDVLRQQEQDRTTEYEDFGASRTSDSRLSKKSQRRDISNIIETVSAKECTVVSQRNIADSVNRSGMFGNPVAAMMIAPPSRSTNLVTRSATAKKTAKRVTPISVPSSTRRTFLFTP